MASKQDGKQEHESIIDTFARLGREMKMPDVDIERIIEHNRRNLEAFEKSARAASSGAGNLIARQREMLEDQMREAIEMARGMRTPGGPKEFMDKQAEFARKSFESAVRNTGEIADLMRQTGSEAIDVLRKRIAEAMEEMREGTSRKR